MGPGNKGLDQAAAVTRNEPAAGGITPLGQRAPGVALPGPACLPTYTALARKTT